jgi:hypothetical protein
LGGFSESKRSLPTLQMSVDASFSWHISRSGNRVSGMTCHMTFHSLPRTPSPPLQPFQPTPEQSRFLHLHSPHGSVTRWQWHFSSTALRAYTETGRTATIWRDALEELVAQGLMRWGHGCADVVLTSQGIQHVSAKERA